MLLVVGFGAMGASVALSFASVWEGEGDWMSLAAHIVWGAGLAALAGGAGIIWFGRRR